MSALISYSIGFTPSEPNGTVGTTCAVAPPPGYAAGDFLLMVAAGGSTATVHPSTPSGWTALSAANAPLGVFYKTATGSEPSSYTVTFSAACTAAVTVAAYPSSTSVVTSSFAAGSGTAVSYTPSFPSGVTSSDIVLLIPAAVTTANADVQSVSVNAPAPWAWDVPFFSPAIFSNTAPWSVAGVGIATVTGSTASPALKSTSRNQFYAGYIVLTATPAPVLEVTVTGSGVTNPAVILSVSRISGAASPAAIAAGGATASSYGGEAGVPEVSITPNASGSLIYGAIWNYNTSTAFTAASGSEFSQNFSDTNYNRAYATFRTTGTTTEGDAVTVGASAPGSSAYCNIAAAEILAAGTLDEITVSAAAANLAWQFTSTAVAQTAYFVDTVPQPGDLLVATVVVNTESFGGEVVTVADSSGLTWTELASETYPAYAGVWVAQVPGLATISAAQTITPAQTAAASLPGGPASAAQTLAPSQTAAVHAIRPVSASQAVSLSQSAAPSGTAAISIMGTWTAARAINPPGFSYGQPMNGSLDCPVSSGAGNWLIAICSWTLPPGFLGSTMEVADDAHGFWIPLGAPAGDTSASGYTRCSIWARPGGSASNPVPGANHVYVAPGGMPGLVYPAVIGVTVAEISGMSPYAGIPAVITASSNAAASIAAGAPAPTAPALMLTVAASDGAGFTSGPGAGWNALGGVSVAGTAPAILHTSPAWRTGTAAQAASWTAASTSDLSACTAIILVSNPAPSQPNPSWPATQLQCAFGSGALTPRSQMTWTDISHRFLAGQETSAQRGKNRQLDQTQAGTISLTLDNRDSALDPGNTASPFYPDVVADTPIRLLMTWEGRTYSEFFGYVSKWPQQWKESTRQGLAAVTVTDAWSLLIDQLAACQQAEMLLTGPYAYWTCGDAAGSAYAANWAPGNTNVLTVVKSKSGALTAVADFGADSGANQGDPSGTLWSQSGLAAGDNGYGYALVCADGNYPPLSTGTTVMGWFNPTGGAVQVNANLCLMRASNAATGPMWQVDVINPSSGTHPGGIMVTVWDKVTRAATVTTVNTEDFLVAPLGGILHIAMLVTQTSWQVIVNGGGFTGGSGSCNLPPVMSWLSFMGTADRFSTGGMFNGECCHLGVFPAVLPADRVAQIVIAGYPLIDNGEFATESPANRIERLAGYGGWAGPRAISTTSATQMAGITDIQGSAGNVAASGVISAGQGQQAGQAITNIVASDNGFLSTDGNGVLCYLSRRDFYGQGPQWFVGELTGDPLNGNWSLAYGVTGWAPSGGAATFAPSGAWTYLGYPAGLLTPDGVTAGPGFGSYVTGLSASTAYLVSTVVNCPAGFSGGMSAKAAWYDASGTLIATSTGSAIPLPSGTPGGTLVSAALTSPAATAAAEVSFAYNGTPSAAQYAYAALPMIQPETSAGTAGEYPAQGDITFSEDKALLYNTAQLTQSTGTGSAVTSQNSPSALQHGQSPFTATVYQYDPAVVADEANWIVNTQGAPVNRFETVTVSAAANPANWPFVLGAEPGTPLQVARRPVTAQTPTVVQGIAAQVTRKFDFAAGTAEVTCTGDAFPEGAVLTADDPLLGRLNSLNRLGW